MNRASTAPDRARIAARMLAVLCAAFMASQFFRVSNAVIAPELMRTLSISSEAMGVITGAFFFAFGIMQVPTGILLDRFGPRRTMSGLFVVAAAGSAVFATAEGTAGLVAGRALIGVGCAAGLMGMLVTIARWYPPERFAKLSSMVYVVGGAGVLFATTPLAAAADTIGWRGAFWAMTGITLGFAAMLFAMVRDAPPGREVESAGETFAEMLGGVRAVCRNRQLWHVCAIQFVNYGSIIAVIGLWAGPYLNDIHGLQGVARGNVLFAINVSMLAAVIGYGVVERRLRSRKRAIAGGSVASAAILARPRVVARHRHVAGHRAAHGVRGDQRPHHAQSRPRPGRAAGPSRRPRPHVAERGGVLRGRDDAERDRCHRRQVHGSRRGRARRRLSLGLRISRGDDRRVAGALHAGPRHQGGVGIESGRARSPAPGAGDRDEPRGGKVRSGRRVDELQAALDPVEPISLMVEARMHIGDIGLQIRQVSLDRAYPVPHVSKLTLHVLQRGADCSQVLQGQVVRHVSA